MPLTKKRKIEEKTQQELCEGLFEILQTQKLEDGSLLCEPFIHTPNKSYEAGCHDAVSSAMDLREVGRKVKEGEYAGVGEMQHDFDLVINNAFALFPEDSKESTKAKQLQQLFKQSREQLMSQAEVQQQMLDQQPSRQKEMKGCMGEKDEKQEVIAGKDEVSKATPELVTNTSSNSSNKNTNNSSNKNTNNSSNNDKCDSTSKHNNSCNSSKATTNDTSISHNSTDNNKSIEASSLPSHTIKKNDTKDKESCNIVSDISTPTNNNNNSNHSNVSSTNNSPLKSKAGGACLDESSRSGFSNAVTSGSEVDDEARSIKSTGGEVTDGRRKRRKGKRRTNKEILEAKMAEMAEEDEQRSLNSTMDSSATEEEEAGMIEQLFSSTVVSSEGTHSFSELFKIVPSKMRSPMYYEVVTTPMDLRMIARKIQAREYAVVDDMLVDFMLIISNAKSYNEVHSRTYKEATSLKKHLLIKKHEMEQRKQMRSQRTRCRTQTQAVENMSSVFAALKSESEDERAGSDGEFSESGHVGNEQWMLFHSVKNHKDDTDAMLSEPFLRLPSKRFYPDYFQEIKNPLSLLKIQKKIKAGLYSGLEMLSCDFEVVFDNAMQYNREDSRIYKDADTLLGVMRKRVQEIVEEKTQSPAGEEEKHKRPRLSDEGLKKTLWSLYNTVFEHQVNDRTLIDIFLKLPSKRDYPDYYDVIIRPIDMATIEYKIQNDRFHDMSSLVEDFKLMFSNARLFNKEHSQVHNDASCLERLVEQTYQSHLKPLNNNEEPPTLLPITQPPPPLEVKKVPVDEISAFTRACLQKQQELFGLVRQYKDPSGKFLSAPFINLPLKADYPDYYETISKPMDLTRVYQRIVSGGYGLLDEIFNDLSLIFTNACLYNEPESQIYKDAVSLQRVCNERKAQWNDQAVAEVVCVDVLLQSLLKELMSALMMHKDPNGRVYSNSFHELNVDFAGHSYQNKPNKSLEQIQSEVETGSYKRLDSLQEHLICFFSHVLNNYKNDRQLVEDSEQLLKIMITKRNQLCGCHGDEQQSSSSPTKAASSSMQLQSLSSPALSYDFSKLQVFLNEKGVSVKEEDEEEKDDGADDDGGKKGVRCESVECSGRVYSVGDFVYIKTCSKVVEIRRIWKRDGSLSCFRGVVYMPPQLSKHHPKRTFMQKEVLQSSQSESFNADVIGGKCLVLPVFQYALYLPSPEDVIGEKDVYVCEWKYHQDTNVFRLLKKWTSHKNMAYNKREAAIQLYRAPLTLATTTNTTTATNITATTSAVPAKVDRQRVIVQLVRVNADDPHTYYEQVCTSKKLWIKLGDCVVVKPAGVGDKGRVIKVEKIWTTNRGDSSISGPLLLRPSDVSHHGNRSFYRKELLLSNKELTQACMNLSHTCVVMGVVDYCTKRVIGCGEEWVFLCDLSYNEYDKSFKKAFLPIKQPGLSDQVCCDEVVTLMKPVVIAREQLEAAVVRTESAVIMAGEEESMDFFPSTETSSTHDSASFVSESFSGGNIAVANNNISSNGAVAAVNGATGGNNSKEDASASVKKRKKRASTTKVRNVTGYIVYAGECRKNIQAEFPDLNFGDISRAVGTRWKSLPRDLKEKYEERARQLTQEVARGAESSPAAPDSRSMSPATLVNAIHAKTIQTQQHQQQQHNSSNTILPTIDLSTSQSTITKFNHGPPIFVDVPPQTYKVVHSEAYIRYIHGLAQGNKFIGDFNKSLGAKKPDPLSVDATKLPSHWLANGPSHHGDVVSAFWALRQHMLNDALRIDQLLN